MNSRILCYTISRASTAERAKLFLSTLTQGRDTAGCDFDWEVHGNSHLASSIAESTLAAGVIQRHVPHAWNVGQHPPTNAAIKRALDEGYDYLLRVDDDVEWLTKRWLIKLIEAEQALSTEGHKFILSPTVHGLRNPPKTADPVEVAGMTLKFIEEGALGGICRLHPVACFREHPYESDVRLPMGLGDASGIGKWATEHCYFMAYLGHIRVRHAKGTAGQEAQDPQHFDDHTLLQHLPYVPSWP